jgi:hypothetical protein
MGKEKNNQYRFIIQSTVWNPPLSFLATVILCNGQAQTVKIDAVNHQGMLSCTAPAAS